LAEPVGYLYVEDLGGVSHGTLDPEGSER
jgi:hypothetical protein